VKIIRLSAKITLLSCGIIAVVAVLLFASGILSTPRDFSSPQTTIRIVDQSGTALTDLQVSRNWYDSDTGKEGCESAVANQAGDYTFPKVPANVGVFTGTWRKAYSTLGMCGAGSGTYTKVNVRFQGRYDVLPQGKTLHPVGQSQQDQDGVWFISDFDSASNTLVSLTFPSATKIIDYTLTSKHER